MNTIVRCTRQNFEEFPVGIPADTTELYLNNNEINFLSLEKLENLTQLVKM